MPSMGFEPPVMERRLKLLSSSLAANTGYLYRAWAYNALRNSAYSNEAGVVTSP